MNGHRFQTKHSSEVAPEFHLRQAEKKFAGRQRGVALIIALLVVALATVLIAALLDRGELNAARVRNQLRQTQALAYAQGLEAYAARVLQQAQASGAQADSNNSPWAVPLPPTKVPGGDIVGTMRDRNGCFNLNNLIDPSGAIDAQWLAIFQRLLRVLKLDVKLADAVVAWMNNKSADDPYYLQQEIPYRPSRQAMAHVSELRLVKGVSVEVYARLAPEVCALPRGSTINVNTASVAVLMSLADAVDEQTAKAIWQDGHANLSSADQLPSQLKFGTSALPCSNSVGGHCVDVKSTFFLARADITLDELPFVYYSLIERLDGNSGIPNAGIRVIERSSGGDF
jgi:general secretion pathway protein K